MILTNRKKKLQEALKLKRLSSWIIRRYGLIILLSFITFFAGAYYSVELFKNLRTDLEELLPENARSVQDLKAVAHRMGGLNHLSIVVESDDKIASLRFVKDLSKKLREQPKDLVDRVEDNITDVRDFFYRNRSLYLDLKDWESIEDYVIQRFRYERKVRYKHSLLGSAAPDDKPEFDLLALKKKYSDRAKDVDRFPDGYFISRDGKTRVVLARLPGKVTDIVSNQKLSDVGHKIVNELNPKSYAADMVVGFDGDVQNVVEEHHGLMEDLLLTSVVVMILVTLALILFFKSIMASMILTVALLIGTAWTFGASFFLVGYLNANTAFMGSVVLGNGINFGIILLARYMEERRRGVRYQTALARSIGFTSQATWIAALAAGLSYLSLILTDFRGFNQFGIIGFVGMVLCWIASFIVMPAFLVFAERKRILRIKVGGGKPVIARLLGKFVLKFHKPIFFLVIVSIFVSGYYVMRLKKDSIEMDLTKLRNKESLEHGSGFWGKKVDKVFEQYLTPTLIMTTREQDALKVRESIELVKKEDGVKTPISEIKSIDDFLPLEQTKKLRIMERIKSMLPKKVLDRLDPEDRKLVMELLPDPLPEPVKPDDLPALMKIPFKELDGKIGRIVHAYPKFENGEFWDGNEVIRFTERLREGVRRSEVAAVVAGQAPISADMIAAIKNDGPKATFFAFLSVLALVFIIFPKFSHARAVMSALLLGVLWMGAIMGAWGLKINFLNFIALPITFGIGVDYGVNIFSRYISDRNRSIQGAIEHSGGAVALCSLTTIIGFGSLTLASNQAFVSFGWLAIIGEFTCLTAALVALPATLKFFAKSTPRGARKLGRGFDVRDLGTD